jgi:hypothetical protein
MVLIPNITSSLWPYFSCLFILMLSSITDTLTFWSRVCLEKVIVTLLLKKFSAFCEAQKFITVFTTAYHGTLTQRNWIHSALFHHVCLRSILIWSSDLCLGLQSSSLPSGFLAIFYMHLCCLEELWSLRLCNVLQHATFVFPCQLLVIAYWKYLYQIIFFILKCFPQSTIGGCIILWCQGTHVIQYHTVVN